MSRARCLRCPATRASRWALRTATLRSSCPSRTRRDTPTSVCACEGRALRSRHGEDVRGSSPFTWSYTVTGAASGVLEMTFVADPANQEIARCSVWVREGPAPDVAQRTRRSRTPASPTRGATAERAAPNCRGVPCGGDDGCGTPCSGSHRDAHGAVSDCRAPGDCGCGVEDNGNMVCGDDGQCVIRCSCDCLPPQRRPASAVARLDRAGACLLVFRESGDPTVWDAVNGRPLCRSRTTPSAPRDAASVRRATATIRPSAAGTRTARAATLDGSESTATDAAPRAPRTASSEPLAAQKP
jgi:hypothetical protein